MKDEHLSSILIVNSTFILHILINTLSSAYQCYLHIRQGTLHGGQE